MHDCANGTNSPTIAFVFWVLFQLVSYFVFMNVFIAVIYENFNDIHQVSEDDQNLLSLKKYDIKNFQRTWAEFNPEG